MRKIFPYLLLCFVAVPLSVTADTVIEEIIARVNNQIITRTEYQRSKEQLKRDQEKAKKDAEAATAGSRQRRQVVC